MAVWTETWHLLLKDIKLEWRQRYAFNGLILYVVSTCIVVYMAFMQIDDIAWVTIFWIILLFASINAVAKSFLQESQGRMLFYYSLASPVAVILSKIIYNCILLATISLIALFFYSILLGNPVEEQGRFLLAIMMGVLGFSLTFTLISAIASKAGNNATLMPILSFPIIIPMLGLLIKISKEAMLGVDSLNWMNDLLTLLAINVIALVASLILFPYLWRD